VKPKEDAKPDRLMNTMEKKLDRMSNVFKALGDPTRLKLIRLLASNMEDRLCVIDLAQKLHVTQPAASQHLKVLKNIGVLYSKREGNRVFYYIDTEALKTFKTRFDDLLRVAFTKCAHDGDCENCPIRDECEEGIIGV
jgi:ArsR family transcriptional regulator